MSIHDKAPDTNDGSVTEQIPHSGVHHGETPVRDFDNTTLGEAVDRRLIKTPSSPAELTSPAEHRSSGNILSKLVTTKLGRRASLAVATLVAAGAVTQGLAPNSGGEADRPTNNPVPEAPESPGSDGEVEPGTGGVTLTTKQLEALNSGDEAAIAEVMTETLAAPLSERMVAYSVGETNTFDISDLVSEAQVQDDILNTITTHWPDFDEKRPTGLQLVSFCYANVINPDAIGGPCEGRFSEMHVGEPLVLDAARTLYNEDFSEVPEDPSNLAQSRPEFNFDTLYVSLEGNTLSIAKR